jgi:hypothetical protein
MTGIRLRQGLGAVRLMWAGFLLVRPHQAIHLLGGEPDRRSVIVARILGARHAGQGAIEALGHTQFAFLQATIDGAHGLTALLMGIADPQRRRPALTDAAAAAGWAVLSATLARNPT